MTDNTLRKSIYLQASKSKVWEYLTHPDRLAEWFHKPKHPLENGQAYEMFGATSGDKMMWGEVTSARPFDYLEYTFTITPMGDTKSTVQWTLEEVPGGTRLSLEHAGLPPGADAFGLTLALDKGWDDHFGQLRAAISPES